MAKVESEHGAVVAAVTASIIVLVFVGLFGGMSASHTSVLHKK